METQEELGYIVDLSDHIAAILHEYDSGDEERMIDEEHAGVLGRKIAASISAGAIILRGNLSEGYQAIGPFPTFDEAAEASELLSAESFIMSLQIGEND